MLLMSGEQVTNSELNHNSEITKEKNIKSRKVDINILLNKVRAQQKKEKFENTFFFALITAVIVVTGIIVSL